MVQKLRLFFFIFIFLFLSIEKASAQEWVIKEFHSDITIEKSGLVRVEETITVDFSSLEKHGIFRVIPYMYSSESGEFYTEIAVEDVLLKSVTSAFSDVPYDQSVEDSYLRLKIGDPDKTISGENTYKIVYTAKGILSSYDTYDEFYWNVTGNNWEVPIGTASAVIRLPEDILVEEGVCFYGREGSTASCSVSVLENQAEFVSPRQLEVGEGMTGAVRFEKGVIPILTVDRPKSFFERFVQVPSLSVFFGTLIVGLGSIFFHWYRNGRDFWNRGLWMKDAKDTDIKPIGSHETIVVEYTPPEKLRPAEIGVLVDEKAHTHDVTATIIDLAVRGYLTITEKKKTWIFGKTDYTLHRTNKIDTDLLSYEKLLLKHLFSGKKEVSLSDLKKTFYEKLKQVKDSLYQRAVEKRFFMTNPDKVRQIYGGIGVGIIVLFFVLTIIAIRSDIVYLAAVGLGGGISGGVLLFLSQSMPKRTAYGRELYRRALGYRLFITTVEKHRQKFFEEKNLFNEVLPYAIVFELTDKYINAMKDMGIKPSTSGWYHGTGAFHMAHFASSMNSFSSSFTQAVASAPKSSGFSSGGGFSGGGFGGGGGGSW